MEEFDLAGRMQLQLELAAEVQRSMLPDRPPTYAGYSFWHFLKPNQPVGGDMFDFRLLSNGELFLLAADVAGKGIGAAMEMAWLAGMVGPLVKETGADLERFLGSANSGLLRLVSRTNRFVNLIALVLNGSTHQLRVASAAYGAGVLHKHSGTVKSLCPSRGRGSPLGVCDGFQFSSITVDMRPGDAVMIVSDGVTNASSSSGQVYGVDQLSQVLAHTVGEASGLGEACLADLIAFAGKLPMQDDVTMLCFRRNEY